MSKRKCFVVTAKCGHVRRRRYILKEFPVMAFSMKSAAQKVKGFPRVKKHCKTCIVSVREVSAKELRELYEANGEDPYFQSVCTRDALIKVPNLWNQVRKIERRKAYKNELEFPSASARSLYHHRKEKQAEKYYWKYDEV